MSALSLSAVGTHPKGFWGDELVQAVRGIVEARPGATAAEVSAAAVAMNPAFKELDLPEYGALNLEKEVKRVMWTLRPVDVALRQSIAMVRGYTDMSAAEKREFVKNNARKTKHEGLYRVLELTPQLSLEQLSALSPEQLSALSLAQTKPSPAPEPAASRPDPATAFLHNLMHGYAAESRVNDLLMPVAQAEAALATRDARSRWERGPSPARVSEESTRASPPIPWQEHPGLARLVRDLISANVRKNRMAWAMNVASMYGADVPQLLARATGDQLNRAVVRAQAKLQ